MVSGSSLRDTADRRVSQGRIAATDDRGRPGRCRQDGNGLPAVAFAGERPASRRRRAVGGRWHCLSQCRAIVPSTECSRPLCWTDAASAGRRGQAARYRLQEPADHHARTHGGAGAGFPTRPYGGAAGQPRGCDRHRNRAHKGCRTGRGPSCAPRASATRAQVHHHDACRAERAGSGAARSSTTPRHRYWIGSPVC